MSNQRVRANRSSRRRGDAGQPRGAPLRVPAILAALGNRRAQRLFAPTATIQRRKGKGQQRAIAWFQSQGKNANSPLGGLTNHVFKGELANNQPDGFHSRAMQANANPPPVIVKTDPPVPKVNQMYTAWWTRADAGNDPTGRRWVKRSTMWPDQFGKEAVAWLSDRAAGGTVNVPELGVHNVPVFTNGSFYPQMPAKNPGSGAAFTVNNQQYRVV